MVEIHYNFICANFVYRRLDHGLFNVHKDWRTENSFLYISDDNPIYFSTAVINGIIFEKAEKRPNEISERLVWINVEKMPPSMFK